MNKHQTSNLIKLLKDLFEKPRIPAGTFVLSLILIGFVSSAITDRMSMLQWSDLSKHYSIGQKLSSHEIALEVESIRKDNRGRPGFPPKPGYTYLMPKITIENHQTVPFELIPLLYFYIKDQQGNVYHIVDAPIETDQLTGPILPGETVREEIGFEVPENIIQPALYFERGTADHAIIVIDLVNR